MVWVTDNELQQIADFLDEPVGAVKIEHTRLAGSRVTLKEFANGDCTFFDGEKRSCKIYPVRPTQCKTWPFWNSNLESSESWQEVQAECPGAGHGDLYSLEQIDTQANRIGI